MYRHTWKSNKILSRNEKIVIKTRSGIDREDRKKKFHMLIRRNLVSYKCEI